jgi:redox-sensitive bicupin YhaK (pirin superfamily)
MITVRTAAERGRARYDWLNSYHSFSFGEYYDPRHMGVSNLRVINDDTVAPNGGFATHGHRDMEIISYVLSGALEHKDSLGNGSLIRPGDVQRMSAGTGVLHSEYNPSATEPVHFLQIWLQPNRLGVTPDYAQKHFAADERRGQLRLLVSPDGRAGSITAQQDALLYGALLEAGEAVEQTLETGRKAYVYVARGAVSVNARTLTAGDGARIDNESTVRIEGLESAEVLLFDLP